MPAVRVLELRSAVAAGGGPEKTIMLGAVPSAASPVSVTVCYLKDRRDKRFAVNTRAHALPIDYVEIPERHSFDVRVWPALRRLVRDRRIDIVHAHDYKTDLLALMLAKTDNLIPLATAHGWTGHSARERLLYYPLDKWLLSRYPRVVAVSGEIRDELRRTGASPHATTVVLNAIDPNAFRRDASKEADARRELGVEPDAFVLGAVGRLEPQKRFDLLLEVFGRLRATQPMLRLLIAGSGQSEQDLQSQIHRLGLSGPCRLLGHLGDIKRFHHALDLFVQSSQYEGTSNAVLEAMAMETPIVATDVGGTTEQIEPGVHGLITPPNDAPALERAIEQVIADASGAARRAAAARARVEGPLSFSARQARLEGIYMELMASYGRSGTHAASRAVSSGAAGS